MIMSRPTTILCRPDSVETARKIIKATQPADQEEEQLRRKLEAVIVADDVTERDRQESLAELLNKPGEEPIIAAPDRCLPPGITPGQWEPTNDSRVRPEHDDVRQPEPMPRGHSPNCRCWVTPAPRFRDHIAWLFTGGPRGFRWYNAVAIYGAVIGAGLGLIGLLLWVGKWLGG